ncbi:hypothetical protein IFR05_012861 [Cadophora sp. M221]|nr:hypothetical protein IFR05_012861 [Cadophora sp. M221]
MSQRFFSNQVAICFSYSGTGRGHLELNITHLRRPVPEPATLMEKQIIAAAYIEKEHQSFCAEDTDIDLNEGNFEQLTRSEDIRRICAADILKRILIRGRYQAAVFNVFMQLCAQGVCSLHALEQPVDWNNRDGPGTCFSWIYRMLGLFRGYQLDWGAVQEEWGINQSRRWYEYAAPIH